MPLSFFGLGREAANLIPDELRNEFATIQHFVTIGRPFRNKTISIEFSF